MQGTNYSTGPGSIFETLEPRCVQIRNLSDFLKVNMGHLLFSSERMGQQPIIKQTPFSPSLNIKVLVKVSSHGAKMGATTMRILFSYNDI